MRLKSSSSRGASLGSLESLTVYAVCSFCVSTALSQGLTLNANPLFILFASVFLYGLWFALHSYAWIGPAALASLATAALASYLFRREYMERLAKAAAALAVNLWRYLQGREALSASHLWSYWVIATIALSLYAYRSISRKRAIARVAAPFTAILAVYWFAGIPAAFALLAAQSAALWYWYGAASMEPSVAGSGTDTERLWRRSSLRYALVITLVAAGLPALRVHEYLGDALGGWFRLMPGADKVIEAYGATRAGGQSRSFSFSETGFQAEAERLGGPVKLIDTPVFRVESPVPLYLRGAVKSRYEDSSWKAPATAPRAHRTGALLFEEGAAGRTLTVGITALDASYKTVFSPYRALEVHSAEYDGLTMDEDGNMLFADAVFRGESYYIRVSVPDGRPSASPEESPASLARYLELPVGLPGRVSALARAVAEAARALPEEAGGRTMAEAAALRDHLRSSYPYSLEARQLPRDRDFVDFFLFDEKRGYCTYFASALAVMLRTRGIPSRYVEGYLASDGDEAGTYLVRQRHAHTWVEAYIEPFGWTTLEATPAFPSLEPGFYRDRSDPQATPATAGTGGKATLPNGEARADGAALARAARALALVLLGAFLAAIFVALPARVLYAALKRRKAAAALAALDTGARYAGLYAYTLKLAAILGHGVRPGETAREFAAREQARFSTEGMRLTDITAAFERARYGALPVEEEAMASLEALMRALEGGSRVRLGWPRYLWMRWVSAKPMPEPVPQSDEAYTSGPPISRS